MSTRARARCRTKNEEPPPTRSEVGAMGGRAVLTRATNALTRCQAPSKSHRSTRSIHLRRCLAPTWRSGYEGGSLGEGGREMVRRGQCTPPHAFPDESDLRPPGWSSNRVAWASLRGRWRCRATLPSSWPRCRRPRWEDRRRDSRSHRRSPENRFRSSPREPLREDRCRVRL